MTLGVKTHNGRLCVDAEGRALRPLADRAEATGRATGVVSTVLFAHATPAGCAVAHQKRSAYAAISHAMIHATAIDVIMGPGHPWYDTRGHRTAEPDYRFVGGQETWAAIVGGHAGGDADGDGRPDPWTLLETRDAFRNLVETTAPPRRVLGIPRVRETLQQQRPGDARAAAFAVPFDERMPTLREMSLGALNVLARDPDGFFVLIEGGAVDWASHERQQGRMIEELVDFNRAVAAVVGWVETHGGWSETLVVVTADHECGYLVGADPDPQAGDPWSRVAPPPRGRGRGVMPQMQLRTGEHTALPVPLFARGAGSARLDEAVRGTDPVLGRYLDNADLGRVLCGFFDHGGATPAAADEALAPAGGPAATPGNR
jgi:alkaline phosphatase